MDRTSERYNEFGPVTDCGNKLVTVGKMHMIFLQVLNFSLFVGYKNESYVNIRTRNNTAPVSHESSHCSTVCNGGFWLGNSGGKDHNTVAIMVYP